VDLGVIFAFDASGTMGARRYVNLEQNLSGPQSTNFIEVSSRGSWSGSPHNISTYLARFPVMGPFIEVFVYNRAPIDRTVGVSANHVHGCGRFKLQMTRIGRLVALEVPHDAMMFVDTAAYATQSVRALEPSASVGPPERSGTAVGRSHPQR
jgi:hypothetical protein